MLLIFVVGLAVPHAFGDDATLFAVAYAGVRFIHLALYADASRRGNASWSAIAGFGVTVAIGMALLIAGSFFDGAARAILWIAAAAIDYAGPAWLTRERLRGLQRVAIAHFAERYSLAIIICLGESIVAIGLAAAGHPLHAGLLTAVTLGLLIATALWWTYFGSLAAKAEVRLRSHEDPVLAAADSYSYLHLLIIAGIIVYAVGVKFAVAHPAEPLADGARLALCGGIALYLAGLIAFQLRLLSTLDLPHAVASVASLAVFAIFGGADAWVTELALTAVMAGLVARELTSPV
jgi:low temperature requirement protein LtrA